MSWQEVVFPPHSVHDLFSALGSQFHSPADRRRLRRPRKRNIYNSERRSRIIILLHQKLKIKNLAGVGLRHFRYGCFPSLLLSGLQQFIYWQFFNIKTLLHFLFLRQNVLNLPIRSKWIMFWLLMFCCSVSPGHSGLWSSPGQLMRVRHRDSMTSI